MEEARSREVELQEQLEALRLQQRDRGETTLAARTTGRDGSRLSIMDGSRRQENLSPPRDSLSPVTAGHTPHTVNVSTAPASVHTGPADRIARGKAPSIDPFTGEDPGVWREHQNGMDGLQETYCYNLLDTSGDRHSKSGI